MAANNSNKNDNNLGFNINVIKNICSKYKKYIATGAMLVLLAVVVATSTRGSGTEGPKEPDTKQGATNTDDNGQGTEAVELNAYPQVNGLFENYYKYFAQGDTDAIEKIAFPISDTEKSYIKCFSKYVESCEDVNCYTKKGLAEGEYIVTVVTQMKFKDVSETAPEMASFYVRRDDKGNSYIDNAYSQYNQENKENTTDAEIITLLTEFGEDKDMLALSKDVWKEYDSALEKDEKLKTMLTSTIPSALAEWVASFSEQTTTDDKKPDDKADDKKPDKADDTKPDDEKDSPDEGDTKTDPDDSQSDENDDPDDTKTDDDNETDAANEQTRTAYAKTKVNLREKRSTDSEILQTLNAGTKLTIYGTSKDGWFKVKCKGKTGYVSKEYVVSDPSKVEVQKRTAYAKTTVNMREKRSTDSEVVQTLKAGTKVMIYGTSKQGWFKVRSKGKYGYVKKEYIVSSKSKVEKEDSSQDQPSRQPVRYLNEGDRITLSDSVNIRSSMREDADRVGLAYQGDVVTVIMSYAEGWTKVSWNGQTGYAKTEYLR